MVKNERGGIVAGMVRNRATAKPIYPAKVEIWQDSGDGPRAIAKTKVDRGGKFSVEIRKGPEKSSTQLAVYAFDTARTRPLAPAPVRVRLGTKTAQNVLIEIDVTVSVEPLPDDVAALPQRLQLKAPPKLSGRLASAGIRSLSDLRLKGGLATQPDLAQGVDEKTVRTLDSLAALSLLPTAIETNVALANGGMSDVLDVATAGTASLADALKNVPAAQPQVIRALARDQAHALSNIVLDARVQAVSGQRSNLSAAFQKALPQVCSCSECQSASGPIAYLTDLLDYAIHHLLDNGQPITLTFLQDRFRQPFRDLPASCDELHRKVRRVRLCIEILRLHLGTRAPTRYPLILEAAYHALLDNIGTSYEELRRIVRRADPQEIAALMTRLLLPAAATPDVLLKDPTAPAGDPLEITEAWLNEVFALRDTTLPALATAPDPRAIVPQQFPLLLGWQRRFLWDQWHTDDDANMSPTIDGKPFVDPDVVGLPDLVDVRSNPTPRSARPRTQWSVRDLLEDRQAWIDVTTNELRALVPGPRAALSNQLTALLQQLQSPATSFPQVVRTGMEGVTFNAVRALYRRQQIGVGITSELQLLELTEDELEALGRVLELVMAGSPVIGSEWNDFYSIIVGRLKRFGFFPNWKDEERQLQVTIDRIPLTGLTLSPYHFQPRKQSLLATITPWRPTHWRSTAADRTRWEETLQRRSAQLRNVATVLEGAVDAAELVELPEILRTMLFAAQMPGVTLTGTTRWLTDRYQIDFQQGTCAWTTRIAQAIETLQGVLSGVRNGLLDDPTLTLEGEDFDGTWAWLGRYATWKAAVEVMFHPENVLRPTLRGSQSQGFVEFIESLRSAGKLTEGAARSAVAVYEQYFVDVCNLEAGVCVLAPAPGTAGNAFYNYLFARSTSGRLYWCYFDMSGEQSHWRRLEIPDQDAASDLKLFGAAYATGLDGERFLYFFGQQSDTDQDRIVFARTDLRENANWSALEWQRGVLAPLPANAQRFAFAKLLTNRAAAEPIKLSVWIDERTAYVRALDRNGLAWDAANGFVLIPATGTWRRVGSGTARNGADFTTSTQQIPPKSILAGDFDRDGQDEIVILPNRPGSAGNDLWVMKFDAATQTWNHVSPQAGHPIDADIDIGTFNPPAKFAIAGDFDGDGFPEIAVAADMSGGAVGNLDDVGFWVLKFDPATRAWNRLGTSPWTLAYNLSLSFASDGSYHSGLTTRFAVAGDFDGDGRDEIAVAVTPIQFVEFPIKYNSNAFFVYDLLLGPGGNHTWQKLPDLFCEGKVDSPWLDATVSPFSRFALAGKFHPGDNRDLLLVGRKTFDAQSKDADPNLGNDFWVYRFEAGSWQQLMPALDCANLAIAAKFGISGDFDGDGVPEVALAQEALLPGENRFGFWIEKMDLTGAWSPLADLKYGDRLAAYAVAGDFNGDGRDEIAVVTPDVWQTNVHVFGMANGQWVELGASKRNILVAGGAVTIGLQGKQYAGDELYIAGTAARLLPVDPTGAQQLVVLSQPGTDNTARAYAFSTTITGSWSAPCAEAEVKPAFAASSPLYERPDVPTARRLNAAAPAALGALRRRSNQDYLNEMLFFVPLEIANRLRENGAWRSALDWCRLVYDYGAPATQRIVAAKLLDDQTLSASAYLRWLGDTLNPHAIAETHRDAYLKYTILLIVQCLIDWADAEFARADAESVPLARELYERAFDLLNLPEVRQSSNLCAELLDVIARSIGDGETTYAYEPVLREVAYLRDPELLTALAQSLVGIARSDESLFEKVERSLVQVRAAVAKQPASRTFSFGELREESSAQMKAMVRMVGADVARSKALFEIGTARANINELSEIEFVLRERFVPAPVLEFCVPANPRLARLRQHVELSLYKIRTCKNIVGLDLCLEPYGATGVDPATTGLQPMPYRYATLIERTKQLVELARQMESSMLQFISSGSQARYEELKARQDLELTQAGVQLKELQVVQASDGITSATLQRDRALLQANHFTQLIGNGWSLNEQLQVTNLAVATVHQHAAAIASWIGIWFGTSNAASAIGTSGQAWAMNSQFHGLLASFERRAQEWQFARTLAEQDVRIGQQQITIAQDQLAIANQEEVIATLHATHAQTVVNFLANRFLNADLYEWMAEVLEQVYRFFLQQATQLARIAELQLAFERQEPRASIIKSDYWERSSADLTPDVGASVTGTNSVRGLTGSARLLRDVFELDQFAFAKNQRKQQVSETFSLAQLDPFAFQLFRQTGRLPFATPMDLFDRRFPGHYVRLIKRVRTSVVALIPPTMGIRATLASVGPTRVTIGDAFETVTIQRDPQVVALTSPFNATGLFDLDAQPELLVPFEGLGVDGQWVFDMPLAANPFDYDAIADVLVTFDYTALHSADYQAKMLQTMDRRFGADRAFSFRYEFADAWYDLNNPDLVDAPAAPLTVSFITRRVDFPPHFEQLGIRQVLVQFVQKKQATRIVNVDALYYTDSAGNVTPANAAGHAAASDATGLISTRRGAWPGMVGGAIDGDLTWTFTLPPALKARFDNEEITDIFLVISYEGLLPV